MGPFDSSAFISTSGPGRSQKRIKAAQVFFSQGSNADAVFYLHTGSGKLTVVSERGEEATVTLLAAGDFFGEESMAGVDMVRTATASAVSVCEVVRITKERMLQTLRKQHTFSEFFMRFILLRGIRNQADLVDQLFNSSEKRLARTLLLMAEFGKPGQPDLLLPPITHEELAVMIGTTRSRINFFMNRFRKLGFIEYNGRIKVNEALLKAVLHDQLPEHHALMPTLVDPLREISHKPQKVQSVRSRKLKQFETV